ncbi:Putative flippase GtrA (transmembrane translocase of bactoprenol-linked glucose) [Paracoccus aminovorans]|uniref:Putative flippase GtrA (Transmembrane translocase of bactoprenol-linked glucose) n=1 Tax=Paracoccus aminovorans TaxID=34004 RepID=A0A1I3E263_9RHOB|nr:GtrA family protein [Paracoccus aminovorans]CQR84657.1 putative membrane protein [Paracoccus aminovorans]SFH93045.1 Putative flippase GtrA (transmembrane translocase of bactoprenol-linked glucose) [Paracoccus aminovorans]
MLGAAARFALTGGVATLVHLAIAIMLIRLGVAPLIGNAAAFATAFMVSFWGHHLFTFAGHGVDVQNSLSRFVIVAVLGFIANESSLALLLKFAAVPAELALLVSTLIAAVLTFFLSRYWAFKPDPSPMR